MIGDWLFVGLYWLVVMVLAVGGMVWRAVCRLVGTGR